MRKPVNGWLMVAALPFAGAAILVMEIEDRFSPKNLLLGWIAGELFDLMEWICPWEEAEDEPTPPNPCSEIIKETSLVGVPANVDAIYSDADLNHGTGCDSPLGVFVGVPAEAPFFDDVKIDVPLLPGQLMTINEQRGAKGLSDIVDGDKIPHTKKLIVVRARWGVK